ncbi:hypothetical protein COZ39_02240, partial [Candidatus Roizmanbacteria bacterium CG_4_10_14_3_um_filter_33_21]
VEQWTFNPLTRVRFLLGALKLLQFPTWCSILKIVRTHFAACGGEEPLVNSEWLRREISKPPKSPEKQSARTTFCKSRKEKFLEHSQEAALAVF